MARYNQKSGIADACHQWILKWSSYIIQSHSVNTHEIVNSTLKYLLNQSDEVYIRQYIAQHALFADTESKSSRFDCTLPS